jgi:hypothetical protein
MYLWKPAIVHGDAGNAQVPWDWTIADGRRAPVGEVASRDDLYVAAGIFDAGWRRSEQASTQGDADKRAHWTLRHAPTAGYRMDPQMLASCAGRYEIFPGFVATVSVDGDALVAQVPGQPPIRATAESDYTFRVPVTGAVFLFERDAQQHITGVSYEDNGVVRLARRVE